MSKTISMVLVAMIVIAATGGERALGEIGASTSASDKSYGKTAIMSEIEMIDLFDRWEKVWHEGRFDLVPGCVGPNYIRHDELGDRTVPREIYAEEIAKVQKERPGIRVVVYDHAFVGNRAWSRFSFKWNDPKTGGARSRAGMQSYRTEEGKLVETWLSMQPLGSSWSDTTAQEHWTSAPPIK